MITPRQIQAARMLLGWKQKDLADLAEVATTAIARLEQNKTKARTSTLEKLRAALEAGDATGRVEFIFAEGEKLDGVRLLPPAPLARERK
jgi:predicted transcriptional regulator